MRFANTRAIVLGLGASGAGSANLLLREGARVTVLDSGMPDLAAVAAMRNRGVKVVLGEAALAAKADCDLYVLSPGIDPAAPLAQNLERQGAHWTGELELAFQCCRRPVVAITGTNGKTTTTQLVERMLSAGGLRTVACGNIGRPFSEALRDEAAVDVFAVEVSSFQLETIRTFRPRVAVWLNFTPDHLDRYRDLDEYRAAKLRIFECQAATDHAVVNLRDALPPLTARRLTFSAFVPGADLWGKDDHLYFRDRHVLNLRELRLQGVHNAENVMAALGAAFACGVDLAVAAEAIKAYVPLPHRCELVAELNGVRYINDSKATNLDALAQALESQPNPVVLIAGGKDKGFSYLPLKALATRKVKRAVLIGEISASIEQAWSPAVACTRAKGLGEAVRVAQAAAVPGEVVLFSPGTSSFDMFRDYADRGNQFRQIVQEAAKATR
ncbi:MAG TPA: UDP-N-acetylmuramoyl-L-alanine--D-glutamate ligase [Chthoniobacterales bacterium]